MILPIFVYGSPVLRKVAKEVEKDEPGLQKLIEDMFETMYYSDGLGLAAPQVGNSKRVIVLDASCLSEEDEELEGFKKVLINPVMIKREGDELPYNEGCLSIPNIREDVLRPSKIHIEYYDEDFNLYKETFSGMKARIIQHEYDHLEGVLFIDHLNSLKKRLLKGKLMAISKGKVADLSYKINYPVR